MPQYTLNTPAPPFLAVGHTRRLPELPDLAPPRFSPADQLAEPSLPRTRVVKDVLRVSSTFRQLVAGVHHLPVFDEQPGRGGNAVFAFFALFVDHGELVLPGRPHDARDAR